MTTPTLPRQSLLQGGPYTNRTASEEPGYLRAKFAALKFEMRAKPETKTAPNVAQLRKSK